MKLFRIGKKARSSSPFKKVNPYVRQDEDHPSQAVHSDNEETFADDEDPMNATIPITKVRTATHSNVGVGKASNMYKYAIQEYNQTVNPEERGEESLHRNDDRLEEGGFGMRYRKGGVNVMEAGGEVPLMFGIDESNNSQLSPLPTNSNWSQFTNANIRRDEGNDNEKNYSNRNTVAIGGNGELGQSESILNTSEDTYYDDHIIPATSSDPTLNYRGDPDEIFSEASTAATITEDYAILIGRNKYINKNNNNTNNGSSQNDNMFKKYDKQFSSNVDRTRSNDTHAATALEPEMPDVTYSEYYGDAYVGSTIRYIYPEGYDSMRPRTGPWKASMFIFVLFLMLTIFVVEHCADKASQNNGDGNDDDYMDDAYQNNDNAIDYTRWCGSRPLYATWVLSVFVTALAWVYCCIIGYILARDFAVANGRSQPPGMGGKSDYYVRLTDKSETGEEHHPPSSRRSRQIYQSDGTPQFWGMQINRPTQAAVAVTSR